MSKDFDSWNVEKKKLENKEYNNPIFNERVAWILPMSTKDKRGMYYHSLIYNGNIFSLSLSQLRLVSTKRFRRFVRKISPHQFSIIQDKLIKIIRP